MENREWSLQRVKRPNAEFYLLLSLLSFALSVAGTRLFLELTGYPQLGNSELHIAHVLWGGLLLFVAALLPLLYANRWVYAAGGILSGVGVGLFIDEVGKFITQSNDYFYPPAAPIIYAFFLLVVLLYQRARAGADRPNHAALAEALLGFLQSGQVQVVPTRWSRWQRGRARAEEWAERRLTRSWLRLALVSGLLLLGVGAFIELVLLLLVDTPTSEQVAQLFRANGEDVTANQVFLYVTRIVSEGAVGAALLAGGLLLFARREPQGVSISYLALLVALTVVDLLVFYFDQFSAILTASFQFLLLLALLYYRTRYLDEKPADLATSQSATPLAVRSGEPHEF